MSYILNFIFTIVYFLFFILLGFLILNLYDYIFRRDILRAQKQIDYILKQRKEVSISKKNHYDLKYNNIINMMNNAFNLDVKNLKQNTKLKYLFCVEKSEIKNVKGLEKFIYCTKNCYAPNAYLIYDDIEMAIVNYCDCHKIDYETLENMFFSEKIESEEDALEFMLEMSIKDFISHFYSLFDTK